MTSFTDSSTDPRECMYRLGANMRRTINKAMSGRKPNTDNEDNIAVNLLRKALEKEDENKQLISYDTLSDIHKYLQRIDSNYNHYFYELIDECRVVLPQTRKNEILEKRIKQLKCKEANSVYNNMTNSVSHSVTNNKSASISLGSEFRQMRTSMIAMFNALLAIGGTFLFCYKAVEFSLPEPHISAQVSIGLIGALVVAVAEFYFLIRII